MTISSQKYYIGIDVSKAVLDVFVLPLNQHMSFKNTPTGIASLIKKCYFSTEMSFILEATGGYEQPVVQTLMKSGLTVCVINPRRIRDFAKANGKLAKTDQIDAQIIATFGQMLQPSPQILRSKNQQALADQTARRRQLIGMINMEKNRLQQASKHTKSSIQMVIKTLEKALKELDAQQAEIISHDEQMSAKYELLKTTQGVGNVVATTLVAELPELGQLSGKKISALVGLAPYNCDSGTLRGKRTIWGGRAYIRSVCYMATLVAIKHNPKINSFYQRLCQAGKKKKVAIVACMHKLIIILNAMVKYNQPYRYAAP